MEYQDWLEVRKQGIGSSDAATACGLNPYMPSDLVNTKGMEYQDWLEVRKQGIGSSDAATACGLNP
ncbi:hypothetical protein BUV99_13945, partial [Corynebacterium diphtheriae]